MAGQDDELRRFVRDGLAAGSRREEIGRLLLAAGWPERRVREALARYGETDAAVPVPRPCRSVCARDVAYYLLLFVTLFVAAFSLGHLIICLIEQVWPDPLDQDWDLTGSIRWSMAHLIVATPAYLCMAWLIARRSRGDPSRRFSPARKWLTWSALLIGAGFVIGDLVTLAYWLLSGELGIRIVLKVATVAVIAGSISGYYLHGLRQDERP